MVKSPLFTLWILSGFNLKGVRNCSSFLRLLSLLKIARLTGCLKYHLWSLFSSQFVIKMFHGVTANVLWKGSIGSRVTCRSALLGCEYALSSEFAMTLRNIFLLPGKKAVWKTFLIEFWRRLWQVFFVQMQSGVWDSWGSLSTEVSNQKRKNIKECLTERIKHSIAGKCAWQGVDVLRCEN